MADESRRLDELTHHGLELRSTIGTSYRTLDDEARRLFRRFALVIAPDAPAWTAAALRGAEPGAVADPLDSLVDAQLVTAMAYEGEPDSRYRFHDLVRVYATEALETDEPRAERDAALGRLLGGWLAFAEDAHRDEYGGDYTTLHGSGTRWRPAIGATDGAGPVQRLERERRGLVAAVRQAADEGMDELAWDLALTLVTLFEMKGYFDDWRHTMRIAHAAAVRSGNQLGQAAMHYSLGTMLLHRDLHAQAVRPLRTAVAGFRAAGHRYGHGLAMRHLANVHRVRGEIAAARRCGAEARDLLHAVGDPVGEAHTLSRLALLENEHGDVARARVLADRALALVREVGYQRGVAQALHVSATVYARAGDYDRARRMLFDVLEIVHELDDVVGAPHVLLTLGRTERRAGRPRAAVRHLRRSAELAERLGLTRVAGRSNQLLEEVAADG